MAARAKESENWRLFLFWKRELSFNICDKNFHIIRCIEKLSKVMSTCESSENNRSEEEQWAKFYTDRKRSSYIWEGLFRKITQLLQCRWQDSRTEYSSWRPVSAKSVRRELHKSNIHGSSRDQPVASHLPTHRITQTQNKRTQTSIPWVWFEPTIPVFERPKTVHALNHAATVIVIFIHEVLL
jgi:hypothetical protein